MYGSFGFASELKPLDYYITFKQESQYFFKKNLEKFSEFFERKGPHFCSP